MLSLVELFGRTAALDDTLHRIEKHRIEKAVLKHLSTLSEPVQAIA